MSTLAEQCLEQARDALDAPPPAQIAWNEVFTPSEKVMILKSAGIVPEMQYKRWEKIHPMYQRRIGEAVRRWVAWAQQFAGVFV